MAELLTQIIQRSDTAAAWTEKNPVLENSEFAVESDTGKFKIGDGTKKWTELDYAGGNEAALEAAIAAAEDKTFKVENPTGTDTEELAKLVGASQGDTAIIKREIGSETGKYSYTAYVYNGTDWAAMDGNYSADNVYFSKNLTYTANIGVLTVGSNGSGTIEAAGKNLSSIFSTMLAKEKNPTITQPTAAVTSSKLGSYEVGTTVAVDYTFATSAGKYEFGPATGVTFSNYSATFNGETLTTVSGTFGNLLVEDGTNLSISASCDSSEGAIPKTNLESDYTAGKIAAKSFTGLVATYKNGSSTNSNLKTVTGYRKWFYGYKNGSNIIANPEALTSDQVRALSGGTSIPGTISTTGMQQIFVCIPKGKKSSVTISNNVNGAPCTVTKAANSVAVEGANKYAAADYDVWYVSSASADSGSNTYKIVVA